MIREIEKGKGIRDFLLKKKEIRRQRATLHNSFLFIDEQIVAVTVFAVMHNNHRGDLGRGNSSTADCTEQSNLPCFNTSPCLS